jgi:AP-4 complex subunit epsilon-1
MNSAIVASVSDSVLKLLSHQTDLVRKKTLLVIQKIQKVQPGFITEYPEKMKKGLCDREPSVMAASLNLYYSQIRDTPEKFKDLTPSFVIILKQVIEHKLPKEFDYHRAPAPWIQIKIMQILGLLGCNDQKSSEHIYEILSQALRRAEDSTNNIGFALVYQCVLTAAVIYPQQSLLMEAASCISKFLESTSANLKYLGIRAMGAISKSYPKILVDHQMTVVDCLESKDETLKQLTLDLLYKITNGNNIEVITKKMLETLHSSIDPHFRQNLVSKIS